METKLCGKCQKEKTTKDFYFKKSEKRFNCWCKECVYDFQKKRWTDRKLDAVKLMGGKCCICGYCKNYTALEFHHINAEEKEFDWRKIRQLNWNKVIVELKKCILLCANCHREIHNPKSTLDSYNATKTISVTQSIELKPSGQCPCCKVHVYGTTYCSTFCSSFSKRKALRPTKEQLAHELKTMSWCGIGRKYNVSDNAVRKWAKQYNLI